MNGCGRPSWLPTFLRYMSIAQQSSLFPRIYPKNKPRTGCFRRLSFTQTYPIQRKYGRVAVKTYSNLHGLFCRPFRACIVVGALYRGCIPLRFIPPLPMVCRPFGAYAPRLSAYKNSAIVFPIIYRYRVSQAQNGRQTLGRGKATKGSATPV